MVAAEPARLVRVEAELRDFGVDVGSVTASGQYSALDADALHHDLEQGQHIDREQFEALIAQPVAAATHRWLNLRVYGEKVDLYWRRRDDHLAIELEGCWNQLRSRHAFQLLCGYHRTTEQNPSAICDCHDLVLSA